MNKRFKNYERFYDYYLENHQKTLTRIFHFLGTLLVFVIIIFSIVTGKERFLWYIPIFAFSFSFISHYLFEHNTPTFFKYPIWTLIADFNLFFDIIIGNQKFTS